MSDENINIDEIISQTTATDMTLSVNYCVHFNMAKDIAADEPLNPKTYFYKINTLPCTMRHGSLLTFNLSDVIAHKEFFLNLQNVDALKMREKNIVRSVKASLSLSLNSHQERLFVLFYHKDNYKTVFHALDSITKADPNNQTNLFSIETEDYDDYNYARVGNFYLKNKFIYFYQLWEKYYAPEPDPQFENDTPATLTSNALDTLKAAAQADIRLLDQFNQCGLKEFKLR